jgi:hypothetical protein
VQANADVVQLDLQHLAQHESSEASAATIRQDNQTLHADSHAQAQAEQAFALDTVEDAAS